MSIRSLAAFAAVGCVAGSAFAAPLNLDLAAFPDIASGFIDVSYNIPARGGANFLASGFALTFDDDGGVPPAQISNGTFNIAAQIDGGGVPHGGFLTIGGLLTRGDLPLLTGSLVAIGFPDLERGSVLEFVFDVTGGSLAAAFGDQVGVILSTTGFAGWGTSWNNFGGMPGTGDAVADTAPIVPAPSAFALLVACAGLSSRRRR